MRITTHTGGAKGYYIHQARLISLRSNLTPREYRSTLAHELGHATRGDTPTGTVFDQRAERAADRYAANLLISEQAYREAEILHPGALDAIAHELGVTRHLLMVWQHMQEVNASFDHSPAASGANVKKLAPSTPFALKGTS